MADKKQKIGSTQEHLEFAEIHDGVIITKTGEMRSILMVSSLNFALKSEQEQTAIILNYQSFLNSLNFPIQIIMQSKKMDLSQYLTNLETTASKQSNELLRFQTLDYIDFVKRLIDIANIMDKKFYCIVPFAPPPKIGLSPNSFKQNSGPMLSAQEFLRYKQELDQRSQVIQSGLGSVGLRTIQLNTQQIIELLYHSYNPDVATREKLIGSDELTAPVIKLKEN